MTNRQIALIAASIVAAGRNQFENKEGSNDVIERAERFYRWLRLRQPKAKDKR